MLLTVVGGWILLPVVNYLPVDVFGPTKLGVIEVIVLLGTLLVPRRQMNWPRWSWWDLPMAAWVVMPGISEAANGLGMQRVIGVLIWQVMVWGVPYVIGRIYLSSAKAFEEL